MKITLEPCKNCNHTNFAYASNFKDVVGDLIGDIPLTTVTETIIQGGSIGRLLGHGGGILSLPKLFYQGVFEGRDGHPLLRCSICFQLTVCCIKCGYFMLLERRPQIAELVECPQCKFAFQPCENDDEFTALLARQKKEN